MPLARFGAAALDPERMAAIVPRPGGLLVPGPRVTVYLLDSESVDLWGDEARALLSYVQTLAAPPQGEPRRSGLPSRIRGLDEPTGAE